jgi:hypothetical protein
MDHVPIDTILDLPVTKSVPQISFNFRATDWDEFKDVLSQKIAALPPPGRIAAEDEFHQKVGNLTSAILDTIELCVPKSKPVPHSKRWWNKDLELLRKAKNRLNNVSYRFRHDQQHPSHQQLRDARNKFTDAIRSAKQSHWENFLEETDDGSLWTAAKYIDSPVAGEGGAKTRVPILHTETQDGETLYARSNEDKARIIAKSFFPPPPASSSVPHNYRYPKPVSYKPKFTKEQIQRTIGKLSPYKTPGQAVKDRLLHNMRKRRIPEELVRTVGTVLSNRSTRLRFDDYLSDPTPLENGIGQGDPLSMIVYLYYNADILEVPKRRNELAVAYVDDTAFFAEGPTFDDTHATLKRMMN